MTRTVQRGYSATCAHLLSATQQPPPDELSAAVTEAVFALMEPVRLFERDRPEWVFERDRPEWDRASPAVTSADAAELPALLQQPRSARSLDADAPDALHVLVPQSQRMLLQLLAFDCVDLFPYVGMIMRHLDTPACLLCDAIELRMPVPVIEAVLALIERQTAAGKVDAWMPVNCTCKSDGIGATLRFTARYYGSTPSPDFRLLMRAFFRLGGSAAGTLNQRGHLPW